MQNYYHILEVPVNSSTLEVKKAYRRLAFKYHPDANSSIECTTQFNLINEAYQVLSDAELRKEYDIKLLYGSSFANKKENAEEAQNNYKKYGNSTRNPTAGKYKPPIHKTKDIKIPAFELFMYRTLLSFGIIGFVNSIRDLFIKEWDGINSLSGFFFSIIFTTLLVVSWKNYKSGDD